MTHPRIAELRTELCAHRVYELVRTPDALNVFAQHHVFCVWDFMQLLKSLQGTFTCTTIPWRPADCRGRLTRLVNELVLGEESDVDYGDAGRFRSHFELYLAAMTNMNADTKVIDAFLGALADDWTVRSSLAIAEVPLPVEAFVRETMRIVDAGDPLVVASTFAYGRETIIPGMFSGLVSNGYELPKMFAYYLDRHIELDGGEHGDAAEALVESLVRGPADQVTADDAAISALSARLTLWDAVAHELDQLD